MKYSSKEFTIDEPSYLGDEYGDWVTDICHKDHRGWFAQVSGKTEEDCLENARLMVNAWEMKEALKEIVTQGINVNYAIIGSRLYKAILDGKSALETITK